MLSQTDGLYFIDFQGSQETRDLPIYARRFAPVEPPTFLRQSFLQFLI